MASPSLTVALSSVLAAQINHSDRPALLAAFARASLAPAALAPASFALATLAPATIGIGTDHTDPDDRTDPDDQ